MDHPPDPYHSVTLAHPGAATPDAPALSVTSSAASTIQDSRQTPAEPRRGGSSSGYDSQLAHAWYTLGYQDEDRDDRFYGQKNRGEWALTYSAVFGCVRAISQSLAGVGWHVFERQRDSRYKVPVENEAAWLLDVQASPEMNAFEWRQVMLKDALLGGNGVSEIERDGYGRPYWMWYLSPGRVRLVREKNTGSLWYEIDQGEKYLPPEDVFHLKGLGPDGLWGWDVVALARRSIQLGLQAESFGSMFFGRGPMPGGIVEIPANMNPQQRAEFQRSFERLYGGQRNAGRVVVLSNGVKFTPATLPNDSSQFLESRLFQVGDICRIWGVPPHKLADLSRATFSNIEEQEIAWVRDCLLPWACRLEAEANVKLFGRTNRGRRFTRLNLDSLLRGNSMAQTESVTKKVQAGVMTNNEGREYFDMNPDPFGDQLLVQGAMTTLERAVKGEPAAAVTPPPSQQQQQQPEPSENGNGKAKKAGDQKEEKGSQRPPQAGASSVRRVFSGLLAGVYERLLRVNADKARRAQNAGRLASHVREHYESDQGRASVSEALLPVFEAALLAAGKDAALAAPLAGRAAARHVERCVWDLGRLDVQGAVSLWEARPQELAEADMAEVLGGGGEG